MAVFAGHSVRNFERAPALRRTGIQGMACQTFRRVFRFGTEFKNPRHSLADVPGQRLIRLPVLVLENPSGVFVLQDAALGNRFHAAVTTGGRARSGADVLGGFVLRGAKRTGNAHKISNECKQCEAE